MMHKQLEHYLHHGKKSTIDKSLKRLTSAGTNSLSHNSYAHKAAVLIQQNEFTKKNERRCVFVILHSRFGGFHALYGEKGRIK